MALTQEQYKMIIRYNDGNMNDAEKLAFENDLSKNEDLQKAIKLYRELLAAGNSVKSKARNIYDSYVEAPQKGEADEVAAMIKSARENWEMQNPMAFRELPGKIKNFNPWKAFAIAAFIAGIILTCGLYLFNVKNGKNVVVNDKKTDRSKSRSDTSPVQEIAPGDIAKQNEDPVNSETRFTINIAVRDSLFAANFIPDDLPAGNIPDELQEPLAYYKATQYPDAINAFESVHPVYRSGEDSSEKKYLKFYSHYYTALSYLANNNAVNAIPQLRRAFKETHEQSFTSKIEWYTALAYFKTGNYQATEEWLNKLTANKHSGLYRNRAIRLKNELSKH